MESLSRLASHLATSSREARAVILTNFYGRLNQNHVRANAITFLTRYFASDMQSVICMCVLYLLVYPMFDMLTLKQK